MCDKVCFVAVVCGLAVVVRRCVIRSGEFGQGSQGGVCYGKAGSGESGNGPAVEVGYGTARHVEVCYGSLGYAGSGSVR